jgi:hypothetical protein
MVQPAQLSSRIALILCLGCSQGWADTATQPSPQTHGTTMQQMRDETQQVITQWNAFNPLPPRPIAQVVTFAEEDGLLTVQWPIFDMGPIQGRMSFTDVSGTAVINYMQSRSMPNTIWPSLLYYDISQPDVIRHLEVLNPPFHLQVVQAFARVQDASEVDTTISLNEVMDGTDPDRVTLRVQVTGGLNLVMPAPSLPVLRRQHPMEYEQYLRPLFREFHQEQAVFAVDDKIAWQVVADGWKQPPDLPSKLLPLIARLDADDFAAREQAQKDLRQIGEPAALYLLFSADRTQWTAEQKARVDKFLAEFCPLSPAQAAMLSHDVNFLLDCLASSDPQLRAATLDHLSKLLNRNIAFDLNQPTRTRFAAIEALRTELTTAPTTRAAAN